MKKDSLEQRYDKEFAFLINEPYQDFEDAACTKPGLHELLKKSGYYHFKTFIQEELTRQKEEIVESLEEKKVRKNPKCSCCGDTVCGDCMQDYANEEWNDGIQEWKLTQLK